MRFLTGIYLLITNKRFTKEHRWNETWQYKYLDSTRANQFAYRFKDDNENTKYI